MPLPLIAWAVIEIGVAVAARVIVRQVAKTVVKEAVKTGVKQVAKEGTKQVAKKVTQTAAKVVKKKGSPTKGNTAPKPHKGKTKSTKPTKKKKKDPCKHERDKKKKKYVVYKADEFDKKSGKKIGVYVGRASGDADELTDNILKRRLARHHRNVKQLVAIFETESYAAVRGAEQVLIKKYSTVKQINGVGPNNKKKDDYKDCAKSKGVG